MTGYIHFPAEWEPQSGVLITLPHPDTDWKPYLSEAEKCFSEIIHTIEKYEKTLLVRNSEIPANDTWARDHGPITVFINGSPCLLDFTFNGWGLKFPADKDNQITRRLYEKGVFRPEVRYQSMQHIVLEGGSIESDGHGSLMTTCRCLLSENRNDYKSKTEIEDYFKMIFGLKRVLWLENGYLAGDDTDSHIDTLARFCDEHTIAYVQCEDEKDEHFKALSAMEKELQAFKTLDGKPYRLIPLPMAQPVYHDGERLPATYANFLIINGAVLMPAYGSDLDEVAKSRLQSAFPDREIIDLNCLPLIRQHGSLHCVTMQLPAGVI
jgi:agmatine/peptidylarginine deiminase